VRSRRPSDLGAPARFHSLNTEYNRQLLRHKSGNMLTVPVGLNISIEDWRLAGEILNPASVHAGPSRRIRSEVELSVRDNAGHPEARQRNPLRRLRV